MFEKVLIGSRIEKVLSVFCQGSPGVCLLLAITPPNESILLSAKDNPPVIEDTHISIQERPSILLYCDERMQ